MDRNEASFCGTACHREATGLSPALSRIVAWAAVGLFVAGLCGCAAAGASASGWGVRSVPAPVVADGQFSAVSCSSATACIAVGSYPNGLTDHVPLVERLSGSSWVAMSTATVRAGSLEAVSCWSAGSCVAVGAINAGSGRSSALVERWSGSGWSMQRAPGGVASLSSVWCGSTRVCVAVGTNARGGAVVKRWNGVRWATERTAKLVGATGSSLDAVSCTTGRACTAVGWYRTLKDSGHELALAERWNGSVWRWQRPPDDAPGNNDNRLSAVSCASRTSCAAVGTWQTVGADSSGDLAEHWNGRKWTFSSIGPATNSSLSAVSCASSRSCTAVGPGLFGWVIVRWSGSHWATSPVPLGGADPGASLAGVSCTAVAACVIVGGVGAGPFALQLAGAQGTVESTQATSPAEGALSAVSCGSPAVCIAVGWFESGAGLEEPLAELWNGSYWAVETPPSIPGPTGAAVLTGVSCPSASLCVAVGGSSESGDTAVSELSPFAEVWNGTGWTVLPTPSAPSTVAGVGAGRELSSVSCLPTTACIAVGEDDGSALAERWDGTSWTLLAVPAKSGGLTGVSCTSMTSCVAVGGWTASPYQGAIYIFDGTAWTAQSTPATPGASTLTGVSCGLQTACTAVGDDGGHAVVDRLNGTGWTAQTSPPATDSTNDLSAVSCSTPASCTAVGSPTVFTHTYAQGWDGTTWTAEATPSLGSASASFDGVWCTSPGACIAVGGRRPSGYADPTFQLPLVEQEP
jgi:hypothetical protein